MKKTIFLIASLLAVSAVCAAGCTSPEADTEKIQNQNIVQEEPDDGGKDNNGNEKNKPEFKLIHPENRGLPPRLPHKRHGEHNPSPMPIIPDNPESD